MSSLADSPGLQTVILTSNGQSSGHWLARPTAFQTNRSKWWVNGFTVVEAKPQAPPLPVLGRPAGYFAHGIGYGQVRPPEVNNGGDPTGVVSHITWKSWGGAQATGSGTSDYVAPGQPVASGTAEPVTIVAFDLGSCGGRRIGCDSVKWPHGDGGKWPHLPTRRGVVTQLSDPGR